ncbi:hypothetical protein C2G38_2028247 [Gigaspora rosea]|uniref:Uncharacterized protein n=1 Tax=Gigaspora rosea TaxID=44941 RepID=A0A397W3J2_9GLOM|nr:hypothetical protein C2G38_2028247 [Gigaspora rosea]
MAMILRDTEWSGRWYEFDQKAYIMLYISSPLDFQKAPEIKIEWHTEAITDARQYTISTGFIIIKFQVDTISYQTQRCLDFLKANGIRFLIKYNNLFSCCNISKIEAD